MRDPAGVVAISQICFVLYIISGEYGTFLIRLPRRLRRGFRRRSLTDAAYPLRVFAPRNNRNGDPDCHCEASAHTGCGNLRATEFVQIFSPALSAASRTVEACLHPTGVYRRISVGRGHVPAGELPTAYKSIRLKHRIATSPAQPFARNERYGCGVPLAGVRSSQ